MLSIFFKQLCFQLSLKHIGHSFSEFLIHLLWLSHFNYANPLASSFVDFFFSTKNNNHLTKWGWAWERTVFPTLV